MKKKALKTQKVERIANARADQWMKASFFWCSKMAQSTWVKVSWVRTA